MKGVTKTMLIIRQEQAAALEAVGLRKFEGQMMRYLKATFPGKFKDWRESEILSLVRDGVRRAKAFSISSEKNVARYIHLMAAIDPGLDSLAEHSWMRPILSHPERSEQNKIDSILEIIKIKAPHISLPS